MHVPSVVAYLPSCGVYVLHTHSHAIRDRQKQLICPRSDAHGVTCFNTELLMRSTNNISRCMDRYGSDDMYGMYSMYVRINLGRRDFWIFVTIIPP